MAIITIINIGVILCVICLFIFIGLVINFSVSAGLNLTQVTGVSNSVNSPIVLNDTLVYLDQNNTLWFNQGSSKSSYKPTISNLEITAYSPKKIAGSILFINQSDNNSLWKTDGESFTKLSEIPLKRLSNYQSTLINSQILDSNDIMATDGENVYRYNIDPLTLSIEENSSLRSAFVCSFDPQTFIFRAISPNSESSDYHFYQSGKITDLEFDYEITNGIKPNFLFQFENNCYYKHYDSVNRRASHFKVNSLGEISVIQNPDEASSFNDFFIFNQQLYTFLENSSGNKSSQLYSLSSDSVNPAPSHLLDELPLYIDSFWVSSDYFYILNIFNCYPFTKCGPPPFQVDRLIVFDHSFNIVNEITDDNIRTLAVEVSENQSFLINRKRLNELTILNQGNKELSVKDPNIEIINVLGGDQNVFIQGINNIKNKSIIYKLSEIPTISKKLSGLWVSDDWQSQGLSLHTGVRPDHSEYIFASFYIYKDGLPFWVAGNVDMDIGSNSITIDLSEYKGSSFLANDPNNETEQIPFGRLTLTPQTCNAINALIQIDGTEPVELNMRRITDTTYDNICSD